MFFWLSVRLSLWMWNLRQTSTLTQGGQLWTHIFTRNLSQFFIFLFCLMTDIVHSSSPPQLFLILGFRYLLVHHVMKPSISPLYSSVKIVLSDDSMFPTGNDSLELYKSYNIDIISIFQKTTLHKECNNCSFKKKLQSGQMKTFNCTNMVYYIHGKQY